MEAYSVGFRLEKMNIAKISVKKELGRQFLNQICNKYELEIIDLVKPTQSEPLTVSDAESQTFFFSLLKTLIFYPDSRNFSNAVLTK